MQLVLSRSFVCGSVCSLLAVASSNAAIVASYTVGSGAQTSTVQFDFVTLGTGDTNTYLYEVQHGGGLYGDDLFAIIASAQPSLFSYEIMTFSFGDALYSVGIGSDSAAGFGTAPDYLDYWHYWTRGGAADAWSESWVGFSDRAVSDGSWDGWVFNLWGAPATVPVPAALALFGIFGLQRTRRRATS
ncbi:MAG: hypothetical protein EXS10_08345 [Phycisphaerales bacterium]|nr:hypothetical protein [Phycisphaerales bacterium]